MKLFGKKDTKQPKELFRSEDKPFIEDLKYSFFKTYAEWADSEIEIYNITSGDKEKVLINKFDDMNFQPYTSTFKIGNRTVKRMFLPTNDEVIYHEVKIESLYKSAILTINDYDAYITVKQGDLKDTVSNQVFELNHIYLIPAGTFYNLQTDDGAIYDGVLRNRQAMMINKDFVNAALENQGVIKKLKL